MARAGSRPAGSPQFFFDKTGVRSRRELVVEILGRHYLPGLLASDAN